MLVAVEIGDSVQKALDDIGTFVPKLLFAILILIVGVFVAKFLRKLIVRGLDAVKFDSAVDKSGIGSYLERAGYENSGVLLAKLLYYAMVLLVLQLAISVFGDTAVQDSLDDLVAFIPRVFVALIIIVIAGAVANAVKELVAPAVAHLDYGNLLVTAIGAAIWIIGGFAAFDHLDIASEVVDTLFKSLVGGLTAIMVIKFGVGGIWAARDRFWPGVYDKFQEVKEGE